MYLRYSSVKCVCVCVGGGPSATFDLVSLYYNNSIKEVRTALSQVWHQTNKRRWQWLHMQVESKSWFMVWRGSIKPLCPSCPASSGICRSSRLLSTVHCPVSSVQCAAVEPLAFLPVAQSPLIHHLMRSTDQTFLRTSWSGQGLAWRWKTVWVNEWMSECQKSDMYVQSRTVRQLSSFLIKVSYFLGGVTGYLALTVMYLLLYCDSDVTEWPVTPPHPTSPTHTHTQQCSTLFFCILKPVKYEHMCKVSKGATHISLNK